MALEVHVATVIMFATARQAAGRSTDDIDAPTLGLLLAETRARYGDAFGEILDHCRVWVNGDAPTHPEQAILTDRDEVAILPAVAGG